MKNIAEIKHLFEPKSVAIIGASPHKEKIGYQIIDNIISDGFKNDVYPINPKGGEILGKKVYNSICDIEGDVDLATIVIPAKYVFDAVKECAKKKVKFLSIITSGFSEVGNLEEEKRIVEFAHENGMRVLGPNIFGVYSSKASLNATFGPKDVEKGGVAIITQSGALGIAMVGKTKVENIGLSAIVSLGNKSDITESDLLEYLADSSETKVIFMYIEGIKNGEQLVPVLKKVTKKKPVIVIKSGSSKRGAMAAASHTGSLAGADEVFSDIMKQCGVLRAESVEDALDWCKFLSDTTIPQGENSVIVTNGGGIGVMAADACEKYDVHLYDDVDSMKKMFEGSVPTFGSVKNPVDITGGAKLADYELALKAAATNKDVHSVICLGCETASLDADKISASLETFYKEYGNNKPFVFSFFGGSDVEESIKYLRGKGVPIFPDVYESVSCMGALYSHWRNVNSEAALVSDYDDKLGIDFAKVNKIIKEVKDDGRTFLLSHEAQELMNAANVPVPTSFIAKNIDEAVKHSSEVGYPVVMKIVSKDIIHKSDAGGVALNLENKEEVIDAYQAIMHSCKKYDPKAVITGVEIVEMVEKGTETIIGGRIDGSFGPVIMFGLGGIYVEVMKDVSFRALPLSRGEAMSMIKQIRSYPLLLGVRGEEQRDINGIVDVILKVGAIVRKCTDISDIEVNPLVAYERGDGVKAVDVRILLKK